MNERFARRHGPNRGRFASRKIDSHSRGVIESPSPQRSAGSPRAVEKHRGCGVVAQLVEQWTENPRVGGSIPSHATIRARRARIGVWELIGRAFRPLASPCPIDSSFPFAFAASSGLSYSPLARPRRAQHPRPNEETTRDQRYDLLQPVLSNHRATSSFGMRWRVGRPCGQ